MHSFARKHLIAYRALQALGKTRAEARATISFGIRRLRRHHDI